MVVHRKSYLTPDKGGRGRTPESGRWYEHGAETGWSKSLPATERRELALGGHKGDVLAAARGLQALSNVTSDPTTRRLARADAQYFYREYRHG